MILKVNYLFIFYFLNLFLTTESQVPPLKGIFPSKKGKSKLKEENTFMNIETTSLIMDHVSKIYANYVDSSVENTLSKLKNFMIYLLADSTEPLQFRQLLRILIYVAYIATEYFYSLSLCMIWEYTAMDSETNETLPFLQKLKEDGIIDKCGDKLYIFYDITTAYAEVLDHLINMHWIYLLPGDLLRQMENLELNNILDILNCAINSMYEYKMGSYVYAKFEAYQNTDVNTLRMNLYKIMGDNSKCLRSIRNYFNSSITNNNIIDFRSNIITNSDESSSTVTPSISNNEQFLWRNIVNISEREGDTNPFLILSKCEELRNELTFYTFGKILTIPSFEIPRKYIYPSFNIEFSENRNEFAIQILNT